MKKKFVLTLALVLMVAATLVAATPLEVSGEFKAGYTFENGAGVSPANDYKATINASVAGDFWKVTIANNNPLLFGEKDGSYYNMKADLYLTKALAEQGMDMGDLAITLHVGTGVGKNGISVLADKAEFRKDKQLKMASANNFGVTVDYSDLVKVYASFDPTDNSFPMVLGASFAPIDGVSAAVGFTNDLGVDKNLLTAGANGFAASAKVDVAEFVEMDLGLVATGEFLVDLSNNDSYLTADVAATYEGVGLWVAFQNDKDSVNKLAAEASYGFKVEDIDLSAKFKAVMNDLTDLDNSTYTVSAGAKYALGGATYAVDTSYEFIGSTFKLTPSVKIVF